jgi:hypothetical protein
MRSSNGPACSSTTSWQSTSWRCCSQRAGASDNLDRLADEAAGGAVTVTNARADQVASVAMIESAQQSIALSRLVASLRLPAGE